MESYGLEMDDLFDDRADEDLNQGADVTNEDPDPGAQTVLSIYCS